MPPCFYLSSYSKIRGAAGSDPTRIQHGKNSAALLIGYGSADWATPRLVISDLAEENEAVRLHFTEPCVVNTGSYQGCGCGFNYCPGAFEDADDQESIAVARESREALALYVADNGIKSLYGCWFGDEALPADTEIVISMEQLRDTKFVLPERTRMLLNESMHRSAERAFAIDVIKSVMRATMTRLGVRFPRRFGTRFLLVLTTLAGSAIHVLASSLLQSINTVAQNLSIFYLNFAVFFVLTTGLGALYRRGGVWLGVLLSLVFCSTMLWSMCVWEESYIRYVGIHLLLLLFVAYAFLSASLAALAEGDAKPIESSSLPRQLMKVIKRENPKS